MAVGTTSDFDLTRTELVDLALGKIGVNDPGARDRSLGITILNLLIRNIETREEWQHLISNTEATLTLVANQQAYATGSGASLIATNIARLEYVATVIGTRREELDIIDKATSLRTRLQDDTSSQPTAVHLEVAKLRTSQRMLFYPTPNSAYSVVYKFKRSMFDFDTSSDEADLPSSYALPLAKLLAFELAPHFGTPLQERNLLQSEGETQLMATIAGNAEKPPYTPLRTEYF